MKRILLTLFLVILLFDAAAIAVDNHLLQMVFKPLLMPLIASIYLISVKKPDFLFISALFFAFWGDVLLLFKEYFVFGLASFLMTHVFYIVILYKSLKNKSFNQMLKWLILFLIYFIGIVCVIYPNLNELLIPVLVYGVVIAVFGMMSVVNYQQKTTAILLGALLFIVSDSFLAIDEFYHKSIILKVLTIVLYGLAQYTISNVMVTQPYSYSKK